MTDIDKLKSLEISLENKFIQADMEMLDFFDWCIKNDKTVIIVSEMYLPKEVIEKILMNCGYSGYMKLYVSCEYRKSKNKTLYEYVLNDLKISGDEMLHIGNSLKQDYYAPRKQGIKTALVNLEDKKTFLLKDIFHKNDFKNISNEILYCFIKNNISVKNTDYYNIGYSCIGPLVYGFCLWLHEQVDKDKIENRLFLAREGLLLYKIYQNIFPDESNKNCYMYVSREALKNAGAGNKKLFLDYLNGLIKTGKTALIDIGWKGSMQDNINLMCGDEMPDKFSGYYFALSISEIYGDEYFKKGYAFSKDTDSYEKNYIWFSIKLLEFILCGNQASVLDYKESVNGVIPVFKNKEFSERTGEQLDEVFSGALAFSNDFKACFNITNGYGIDIDYLKPYCMLIKYPVLHTCGLFRKFAPMQSLGNSVFYLMPQRGLLYYLFHINKLKKDIYDSGNSILYLKQLIKIPIPYYKLCMFLRKHK